VTDSTLRDGPDDELVDPLEVEGIDDDEDDEDDGIAPGPIRPQNDAARRWLKGRHWVNNPAYAEANQVLAQVGTELCAEEGFAPDQPEYFREVERRMGEMFPGLLQGDKRVRLDPADEKNMRRFGLNPKDKTHRREYAKSKRGH
jgi:hypothetical protein